MDQIAQILAQMQNGPQGTYAPIGQTATVSAQPTAPFVWGKGGQRLSMDDISRQRELAAQQQAAGSDYSPIASPWQGLARVSQSVIGALGEKKADKDAAAYQAQRAADLGALTSGGIPSASGGISPAVIAGLSSDDPQVAGIASKLLSASIRQPAQPHYFEANNGSQFMIGPDGKPVEIYHDPTPRYVPDGFGGLQPIPNTGGGDPNLAPGGVGLSADLPPGFVIDGGPASTAPGAFP